MASKIECIRWTLFSKKKPKKGDTYLVTVKNKHDNSLATSHDMYYPADDVWETYNEKYDRDHEVVAWAEFPKPCKVN